VPPQEEGLKEESEEIKINLAKNEPQPEMLINDDTNSQSSPSPKKASFRNVGSSSL
jgi:hypothetical protein